VFGKRFMEAEQRRMTQPDAATPTSRSLEPVARGPGEARRDDWRGTTLSADLAAARDAAREALGRALAGPARPHPAALTAWAGTELAVSACLDLALTHLYRGLASPRPDPAELPDDLVQRDSAAAAIVVRLLSATDARTGYVLLEDLLAHVSRGIARGTT
jgi:hypothetical protein